MLADPEAVQSGYAALTPEQQQSGADLPAGKTLSLELLVRDTVQSRLLVPTGVTVGPLALSGDRKRRSRRRGTPPTRECSTPA